MSMLFVITLAFGALVVASASWLGRVYLQLFYRVGFTLVVLYFRNRPDGLTDSDSAFFEIKYEWRRPFPLWQLMGSSLLALFVLLNIAEPFLNQFVQPVGWLGLFLAGWGGIWLALPGNRILRGLNYQLADDEIHQVDSPDETLRTSLASSILGRVKILLEVTLFLLALLCVLHASAPYAV